MTLLASMVWPEPSGQSLAVYYTVLPGAPALVHADPTDTTLYVGGSVTFRPCAILAMMRAVPGPSPKSARVEYRLAGADINPYLAIAASLASGLYGIEKKLELPPASTGNAYETDAQPLPKSLAEATALLKASSIARDLLGEELVDHYVRTREWEVRQYERAVTDWCLGLIEFAGFQVITDKLDDLVPNIVAVKREDTEPIEERNR